jgi:hypothetical protein
LPFAFTTPGDEIHTSDSTVARCSLDPMESTSRAIATRELQQFSTFSRYRLPKTLTSYARR